MATSYSSWYKVGLVKVTNGSKTITGTGTYWLSAGIAPGDIFTLNGYHIFEIEEVLSDTQINLVEAWALSTQSNQSYAIIRNTSRTMNSKIALQTADLHNTFKRYIDTEHKTITGKSAYEVARDNGYTGTAAQWLESLKAAGDYTKLLDKVNVFDYDNAGLHNSIYRGKNLGNVVTDEQWETIRTGKFTDMWLGDYWTIETTYLENASESPHVIHDTPTVVTKKIEWKILAFNYIPQPTYFSNFPHNILLGARGIYQPWNANDHEGGPNDHSTGFAGSDLHNKVLRSMDAYYRELWGDDKLPGFVNDTISSNTEGGEVKNDLSITVAPIKLFLPFLDGKDYPYGGFYWPLPNASRQTWANSGNGPLSRNFAKGSKTNCAQFSNMRLTSASCQSLYYAVRLLMLISGTKPQ